MDDLTALLDALAADGADTAAILAALTPDELDRFASELLDAFDALRPEAEADDEKLAELEDLAATHTLLAEEKRGREAAAAARADKIAELANRVGSGENPDGGDEPGGNGDDDGDEDGGGDGGGGDTPAGPPPSGGEREPATSAAAADTGDGDGQFAARRPGPRIASAARRAPRAVLPGARPRALMRAAANVPGVAPGKEVDLRQVARAVEAQFGSLGSGISGRHQFGLATIERPFPKELIADGADDSPVIDYAATQNRLPGGSLLAAGGWCAPSETLYDITTFSTVTGILSTPEIAVRRGGLRWAGSPDFSAIYANTGFYQTEAQNIAGATKPCYEIPCPAFSEARLDATGLCLTAGILQSRGYPEQVAAFISEALIAHAHRINYQKISKMAALAIPVPLAARRLGPFLDALDLIEMEAEDLRYKYRLAPNTPVETVIPLWMRPLLRTDLQRRYGLSGQEAQISDAQLTTRFAERNIAVQWVYDWQDALVNDPAAPDTGLFGGPTPITDFPTTVDVLMYPAGTYIVANDPIITLEGIYDSVNIRTNSYTALFTEESLLVAKRNLEARRVTVPIDRRLPTS